MMMLRISRQTVRHAWRPYAGAFVALGAGAVLITTAVLMVQAVAETEGEAGLTPDERSHLADLSSLFGIMAAVSMFMALFVVASTFGFVVATRRRELGLLRLVGATPRQVRWMVLGEALVVAVVAIAVGAVVATLITPGVLALLAAADVTAVDLTVPEPWAAWAITAGTGAGVALLGSWRASRRAARTTPVAALQEAGFERRRVTFWQLVIGTVCFGGVGAAFVAAPSITPLFALVASVLLPQVIVIGLMCFGGVVFPLLAALLARPFARRDVAARLAHDHLRTAVRTPSAIAAPVVAISAIAGSLIVTLGFTADWTEALDREQLAAPVVVETNGVDDAAARLDGLREIGVVDARVVVELGRGPDPVAVEAVDLDATTAARGLHTERGDLDALTRGQVAVTETYATDMGRDLGDRVTVRLDGERQRLRIGAVLSDAPDLYAEVVASRELLGDAVRGAPAPQVFVVPAEGFSAAEASAAAEAALATTPARVTGASEWIDRTTDEARDANNLALMVLLGPSALYAGIAIVNSVLIGSAQRRREQRTLALLGATHEQRRRAAMWEAGLVGTAALLTGGLVVAVFGSLVRYTIERDVPSTTLQLPWVPLTAIAVACLGLTLLAGAVGARAGARTSASG